MHAHRRFVPNPGPPLALTTLLASSVLALAAAAYAPIGPVSGPAKGVDDPPSRSSGAAAAGDKLEVARPQHRGPAVEGGSAGPMRVAPALYEGFDPDRAMKTVAFADRFPRAPRDDGYEAVLEFVAGSLREAGYGSKEGFELRVIETPVDEPAWIAVSARVELVLPNGTTEVLHEFSDPASRDRTLLPVGAPACELEGEAVMHLDEVIHGKILLTEAPTSPFLLRRARMRGAAAVVSSSLASFNVDPTGAERHLDAIQYRRLKSDPGMPVFQISPRTFRRLAQRQEAGETLDLLLHADVRLEDRPLRTLVASVVGDRHPDEAVPIVSHVQEPGANDNASGVAGLLESAVSYAGLIISGKLPRPDRTIVFVWGDEFLQSQAWIDNTERTPVAMISSDMTGQDREKTGAIALLERMPDPGALIPLDPDAHTPWGAGEVDPDSLRPNGFAIIARCAMFDVASLSPKGWDTADHPWEGGSDHDTFIASGVPACLFWHFTDFTYHTSLDRMDFVDAEEIHRTAVAILATAISVADPKPEDAARYASCIEKDRALRVAAANAAGDPQLAERWANWCDGARAWTDRLCGVSEPAVQPK